MPYRLEALTPDTAAAWPAALATILSARLSEGWMLVTSVTRDLPPPTPHTVLVFWHD